MPGERNRESTRGHRQMSGKFEMSEKSFEFALIRDGGDGHTLAERRDRQMHPSGENSVRQRGDGFQFFCGEMILPVADPFAQFVLKLFENRAKHGFIA